MKNRRLAFVFGSNGPTDSKVESLRYAIEDVQRVAEVLGSEACGFEVTVPEPQDDVDAALRRLAVLSESCTEADEFICYFSGHGVLAHGSLLLFWHNTDWLARPTTTAIPISRITSILSFCRAQSKILVLDCCHAGAAAGALDLKSGVGIPMEEAGVVANHLVLMASDRLESAREFDELRGSFITNAMCAGLTERRNHADKDGDGLVSIQDMAIWLAAEAKRHNGTAQEKVPIPYLAGQMRGDFFFTRAFPWPAWKIVHDEWTATLLPTRRSGPIRVGMLDELVTNHQFKQYTDGGGGKPPLGQHFVEGKWKDGFRPWHDSRFDAATQPVVCVDADDCLRYAKWYFSIHRNSEVALVDSGGIRIGKARVEGFGLPTVGEWECAAFGHTPWWTPNRRRFDWGDPQKWLASGYARDYRRPGPHPIADGLRSPWGIRDLFGNVWQWCLGRYSEEIHPLEHGVAVDIASSKSDVVSSRMFEVRGGGFLDNMTHMIPVVRAAELPNGRWTRHSDLGFRLAVRIGPDDATLKKLEEVRAHWAMAEMDVLAHQIATLAIVEREVAYELWRWREDVADRGR